MRKEVRKFLFIGSMEDKDRFFTAAQDAGVIEFIDTAASGGAPLPSEISAIVSAKKILRRLEPAPQEDLPDLGAADFIASRILRIEENIERLQEEERLIRQEIVRVQPFGDFSSADFGFVREHSGLNIRFYFAKKGHPLPPETESHLIPVGSAFDLNYYVAFSKERIDFEGVTETHVDKSVGVLRQELQQIETEIHEREAELRTFANRRDFLKRALIEKLNDYHYVQAGSFALSSMQNAVFAVEGWAPAHLLSQIEEVAHDKAVFMTEIAIEPSDRVPTYLENQGLARVGEDIVHVYDSPSTHDRDPSRWVLWFFAFFFGVIVGDAGYGVIILAIASFLSWRFWKRGGVVRRFLKLMIMLGGACLIWGVLTNSWFGINVDPDNPIRRVSLIDFLVRQKVEYVMNTPGELQNEWVQNFPRLEGEHTVSGWIETAVKIKEGKTEYFMLDRFTNNVLMEIALIIGSIHLILAFLRVLDRNWAGIGWIIFIVGGYLFFPSIVHATSMVNYLLKISPATASTIGLQLIWIGLGLAVVLALIQRRLGGIAEIVNVIQVFADVLSYLRLYALGLAGVMMSATFNSLAADVGIVFGVIILLLGHAVNLTLSMMSGVIHGLRLNYLEWYRHCFEGGGRMLQPLKRLHFS